MATLYLTEFGNVMVIDGVRQPMAPMPPLAEQILAIGAGATSSAFNVSTTYIRVCADAACSIAVGAAPTATVVKLRLPGNSVEYFAVSPGQKLAVITNA